MAAGLIWGLTVALATSSSPAPAAGKVVLRLGMTNTPDNLNPFVGQLQSCYEIWSLNHDLMVGFSPGDYGHPQRAAATGLPDRWTSSEGGRVWTFHIRSGVKWQDGVPLTAHDVAFSYNYVMKNKLGSYTMYLNFITVYPESVEAYNDSGWQGWSSTPAKGGGVFFTSPVMTSYLTVHPVSTAAATGDSSSRGPLIGVVVAIVVVIAVVALVASVRGKRVEETD